MAPFAWRSEQVKRWLEYTVAVILVGAIALGLWVRYNLGVVALDGTEECGACHIMKPYVSDLKQSGHMGEANCNDCHVPHKNMAETLAFKAQAGVNNVTAQERLRAAGQLETFVPKATPETLQIIVDNCYRCHDEIASDLNAGVMVRMMNQGRPQVKSVNVSASGTINCLECHTGLVHDRSYRTPDGQDLPWSEATPAPATGAEATPAEPKK